MNSKNVVGKNRYQIIPADNFLCVAAVLHMIINSSVQKDINQNDIAEYFGVWAPNDYCLSVDNVYRTDDPNLWGIIINDNKINEFFKSYHISLRERYIPINTIPEFSFEDEIKTLLLKGYHIICGYNYNYLHSMGDNKMCGHVSIITEVLDDQYITLIDPGPKEPGVKTVKSYDLYCAIRNREGGIWEVSSI